MAQQRKIKGEGSVRKRSDGRWEARCMINGKRRSFYGKKYAEVIKTMREAQKATDEQTVLDAVPAVSTVPTDRTLGEWLTIWLDEYVQTSCKPLTYSTYKSRVGTHILPTLGNVPLRSVTTEQIQTFYNDLLRKRELNPKTIRNVHGILHKALEQAVKLRYISWNPAEACSLPRSEKAEIKPLGKRRLVRGGKMIMTLFSQMSGAASSCRKPLSNV